MVKSKGMNTGARRGVVKPKDASGLDAAERVLAAGGRVPKKFARAAEARARPTSAGPTLGQVEAQAKVSPARRVAFEVLRLVEAGKGHSDDLLRGPRMEPLSEADRHLTTALVMGVLRWQIALDADVRKWLDRPGQTIAGEVMLALRLGAFQLLHMDRIPVHAALSESVELCRAAGQPHATGMVNAVLRKVANAPAPGAKVFETTAAFAERLGHPAWLVERWVQAYGREAALKICAADQQEPAAGGLFGTDAQALPGLPDSLPEIDDGSRLVAEFAAAAMPLVEGRAARVWDCCAAPGGKTLVLAARLASVGNNAELLATDVSERRVAAMAGRLRRYAYADGIKTAAVDATKLPASAGHFDLVLCDVPCSGTGTLGRNPEIRLRLQAVDLERQATRQKQILSAALERVAPGGRLIYSTCSLEREENEAVVEALAADWRRVAVDLPQASGRMMDGALRTLPGVDPCDGFFAVALERTR